MREFRAFRPTVLEPLEERLALSHMPVAPVISHHAVGTAAHHAQTPHSSVVGPHGGQSSHTVAATSATDGGITIVGGTSVPLSGVTGGTGTGDPPTGRRFNSRFGARRRLPPGGSSLSIGAGIALGAAALSSPSHGAFLAGGLDSSPVIVGPLTFGSTGTSPFALDVGQTFGPGFGQDGTFGAASQILF